MKLNSFSSLPEDDDELHLPELVYWASLGDVEQVALLLEDGIDPNQTDEEGYSALQAAAENDHLAVVKLLVIKVQACLIKANIPHYNLQKWQRISK